MAACEKSQAAFLVDRLSWQKGNMTEEEKKLLQAQHRLEEAQARKRVKERKARTRRLIQEGAIFEKACPQIAHMDLKELEERVCEAARRI